LSTNATDTLIQQAYDELARLQALMDAKKVDLASIKLSVQVNKVRQLAALLNITVPSPKTNLSNLGDLLYTPANSKVIVDLSAVDVADIAAATGHTTDEVNARVQQLKAKPTLPSTVIKFVQGLPLTPTDVIAEIKAGDTQAGTQVSGSEFALTPPPGPPPGGSTVTYTVTGLPDTTTILYGPVANLSDATTWLKANLGTLATRGWQLIDSNGVQYANAQPPTQPPPPPGGTGSYTGQPPPPGGAPLPVLGGLTPGGGGSLYFYWTNAYASTDQSNLIGTNTPPQLYAQQFPNLKFVYLGVFSKPADALNDALAKGLYTGS
jgi:hypothetical protein